MTKPKYWVCDQHGSRPACASAQSDQDPCCSLSDSLLVIGLVSKQHGSWSDCEDAHAGLDPCWSQTHYVGFVVTRLKCWNSYHLFQIENLVLHIINRSISCLWKMPLFLIYSQRNYIYINIINHQSNVTYIWVEIKKCC
jgi:hypothetical protein